MVQDLTGVVEQYRLYRNVAPKRLWLAGIGAGGVYAHQLRCARVRRGARDRGLKLNCGKFEGACFTVSCGVG